MRSILTALVLSLCLGVLTANAAPPTDDDLSLRVKVALSLSQSQATACGECVFDEADARAEAMSHNKPLVLLVGNCDGRGKVATSAGAVACVVRSYDGDATARMVILQPKGGEWYIPAKLPATATDDELRKAVVDAIPEKPKAMPGELDWNVKAEEVKPAVTPAKRYRQVCVNGVCHLEEIAE